MSELLALLDKLDEARAKALTIRSSYPSLPVLQQKGADVEAVWSDGADMTWIECEEAADAALIVAAVNALPDLTRAARERDALRQAVLDLAEELDATVLDLGRLGDLKHAADRIRATITAALTPEQVQP